MTTPKSPEQIMEELRKQFPGEIKHYGFGRNIKEELNDFLRSSMASLLCYMAERMPNLDEPKGMLAKVAPNNHQQIIGYNAGLDDCRTLLIEEARKIVKDMILNEMQPSEERIRKAAREAAEDQNKMVEEARKIINE